MAARSALFVGVTANDITTAVSAVAPTLSKLGDNYNDADASDFVLIPADPAASIQIFGWMATGGATALTIELRAGPLGGSSSFTGFPAKATIGAGSDVNLTPGTQPLWTLSVGRAVVFRRSAGSLTCNVVVWYRYV